MVHNYILIYVRNWLRILGKQNALIFNIASIHLPNKVMNRLGRKPQTRGHVPWHVPWLAGWRETSTILDFPNISHVGCNPAVRMRQLSANDRERMTTPWLVGLDPWLLLQSLKKDFYTIKELGVVGVVGVVGVGVYHK